VVNFNPKETNMAKFAVTYRGTVYPWQCDHMGHMNVMWCVGKFDEASWHLLSALGLTAARFRGESTGMAAVEQHIEYKRELHAGDIVSIRSTVLEVNDKAIRITHEMRNDETGELSAATVTVGVYLDTVAGKARPLPSDVRERAKLMIGCLDVERADFQPVLEQEIPIATSPSPSGVEDSASPGDAVAMVLGSCW
jgi:acyl-CoA thioester hydrolase